MFRNEENEEEYVAESYNFDEEEETVLVSGTPTILVVNFRSSAVFFCVRNFRMSILNEQLFSIRERTSFALQNGPQRETCQIVAGRNRLSQTSVGHPACAKVVVFTRECSVPVK